MRKLKKACESVVLPPEFGREGGLAADGPIQIVQGTGDCGPCQEPMGSSYLCASGANGLSLSVIIRDRLVFILD